MSSADSGEGIVRRNRRAHVADCVDIERVVITTRVLQPVGPVAPQLPFSCRLAPRETCRHGFQRRVPRRQSTGQAPAIRVLREAPPSRQAWPCRRARSRRWRSRLTTRSRTPRVRVLPTRPLDMAVVRPAVWWCATLAPSSPTSVLPACCLSWPGRNRGGYAVTPQREVSLRRHEIASEASPTRSNYGHRYCPVHVRVIHPAVRH